MLEGAEISGHPIDGEPSVTHDALDIIPETAGPRVITFKGGVAYSKRTSAGSLAYQVNSHMAAISLIPSRGINLVFGPDELPTIDALPGTVTIHPAGTACRLNWSSPGETVIVSIPLANLQELAHSEASPASPHLRPGVSRQPDLHALHLARLVKEELLRENSANDLYLDSLIALFGIHLLRNYSGTVTKPDTRGRLSALAARRVQDFLDENYSRKLSIAELASFAKLSKGHFTQAFTATFGQSPHQYILNLRLDHAERLLADESMSVAEAAYLSGFSSQSHLTSHMRKSRNKTPSQFRPLRRT
ncbi:helix-turn-helix transcriptional regulator [Rhizobium mesosinicum]|uniref:Helix-turn-helix transcriptional regulator n=2 Tax=Rhizobium mesosinicum TaxID=335017 RepID=A0ABS7H4C4_9HYPH|nr:helix-turn-helix transcriptional regulator [Rhizobium mesosinicum]